MPTKGASDQAQDRNVRLSSSLTAFGMTVHVELETFLFFITLCLAALPCISRTNQKKASIVYSDHPLW